MTKPSSKTGKFLVTIILTLLILLAFGLSGFTISTITPKGNIYLAIPELGEETPSERVNIIKNGGFEERQASNIDLPIAWETHTNGQAFFGFYDERWPEAVLNGKHAQLMEISIVEANILDRVIAVHQTVAVNPDSQYDLTIYAIMRSQAPPEDRNKSEFEMHWGVDYFGEGSYNNVKEWHLMPLKEQFRPGSTGEYPDDVPLTYEVITGTVFTTNTNKITLFIRGLKKFPTGTEVNFDLDDVSLVGPPPGAAQPTATATSETPATTPTPEQSNLPTSGATLPQNVSAGALVLGGMMLIVLGTSAAAALLYKREEI